ncbi:hypothetical protein PHMEG_00021438 [Phytophthora megakarya]|uniref:Uncharacterized protein n=1 Tax=Phytophthora megakarya TaxID=4795 RepID=A0A225VNH8_9STRA|nr:hypothetical protein PHMEG_00021438 [Phytophthora megakarya]
MIQATLTKRLPIPSGFLYPARMPLVRAPIPRTGYRSELITGANVLALLATDPRLVLRQNLSFAALEENHLIAYWESTRYLEITKAMAAADSDLFTYHHDRRQRRIRVGERCWKLLGECLLLMRGQWADIDVLLDPYFLHLPTTRDWVRWYPGSVSRAANLAQPMANLPVPGDLITTLFEWILGETIIAIPVPLTHRNRSLVSRTSSTLQRPLDRRSRFNSTTTSVIPTLHPAIAIPLYRNSQFQPHLCLFARFVVPPK